LHQAKSADHKRFLFFQPTGELLLETEKVRGQKSRSQEAENSRIQEFASVEHALLGSNQRISPDFPAVLAVSVAAHRLSSASGRERKL